MPPPMKPDKIPRPAHIRLFGATRVAPEPQLLPKHFRQHARRLRWRVLRGCWQRFGRCGFRRHGCFRGKYELAPVNKAINLKSQYEIAANSTSVLRLTLTVRPLRTRHDFSECQQAYREAADVSLSLLTF